MKHVVALAALAVTFALSGCEKNTPSDKAEVSPSTTSTQQAQQQPAPKQEHAASPVEDGGQAAGVVYTFGPDDSKIEFRGAKITGSHLGGFKDFKGEIRVNGKTAETGAVNLTIQTASIYADPEKLQKHLRSADFFDVEKYPTATFTSTQVTPADGGRYKVTGDLSMHGVTKQVSFPATIALGEGEVTGKAEFSINRKEFGLVYPGMPDDLIKDDVAIMLDIKGKLAK